MPTQFLVVGCFLLMNRILNMLKNCRFMRDVHGKAGMTLSEVVLVIAIMGILSGMGVSGFQSAIANARTKDAAYNIASFMEWTANESRRLSATLCVKVDPNNAKLLIAYNGSCSNTTGAIDTLILEGACRVISGATCHAEAIGNTNFATNGAEFIPKQGLSAAPTEGFFAVQYGNREIRGAAAKASNQNNFSPLMSFEDCLWTGI